MRWINLHKVSSKHPKFYSWTTELKAQLSSIAKLLTIPLSSVHLILHWYSYKASKNIPFPPVFCTSQFSPSPPWANYSYGVDLIFLPPFLPTLSHCTQPWVTLFLLPTLTLRVLCILCCSLYHGFQISLTRPSLCVPKQGNCWFSLPGEGRNITTIFSPLFILWNGDTILISYLNIFFLHILYQTVEVQMGSK